MSATPSSCWNASSTRSAAAGHDPGRPLYLSEITRVRAAAAAAVGQPTDLVEALSQSVREALADGAVVLAPFTAPHAGGRPPAGVTQPA
ncbi:MAG: hypothetical protein KY460_06020 [Actinobacteria bacterium]|nr:hypothetical protein [Actinomycetota bacterium]